MATYDEVKNDYYELCSLHDFQQPEDITGALGGAGVDNVLFKLLDKPTKAKAKGIFIDLMSLSLIHGWTKVGESRIDNPDVRAIYEKYDLL